MNGPSLPASASCNLRHMSPWGVIGMEFAEFGYLEGVVGAEVAEAVPRMGVGAEVLVEVQHGHHSYIYKAVN